MDPLDFGAERLVLVVDDQDDFRDATGQLLALMGFRVATASNGIDALEILENDPVSLVLTDLFMPKMDGLELMARLRASAKPAPPVIVVTGNANLTSQAVGAIAAALGAKAVLLKPFTMDQLTAAISFAEVQSPQPSTTEAHPQTEEQSATPQDRPVLRAVAGKPRKTPSRK
jgi:CheY-like chemotaxis protein